MTERHRRDSVLVIDDNADFRGLIATIGQIYGVPVLEAPDCIEGLKVLTHHFSSIKLIFLDYFMPGMEPAACAREIVAKAGAVTPIVLMTAAADPGELAAEMRINRWIAKPVEPSVLMELMMENSPPVRKRA